MFFFLSATDTRTPSAVQLWQSPEDSAFASTFSEPYEIYNEIDTATLKRQVKIHTSALGSLTAATEEDTNQTSRQSRKWRIFHQEPITRSVQLPYCVCETAFSQVNLFLDKPFPRIG